MKSEKKLLYRLNEIIRRGIFLLCLAYTEPLLAGPLELEKWLDQDPTIAALLKLHDDKLAKYSPVVRQQLNQLIISTLQQSPLTTEADLLIRAAEQDVESAARSKMPQISISGQNSYTQTDTGLTSPANGKNGLLMQMQMPLYDSGRVANGVKSREAQYEGAKEKRKIQLQTLAQEAVTACSNYSFQKMLLLVNENYTARINRLTKTINEIANIDPGRASELTQAKSRQLQAELSVQMINSKVAESKAELERLLKQSDEIDCSEAIKYFIDHDLKDLDGIDVAAHPQVSATKLEADSQFAYAEQLKSSRKVLVQLGVSRSPVNLALSNEYQNSASITATLPLFDGEVTDRSADASIQRGSAAIARSDALKDKLRTEIKTRYTVAQNAAMRLDKYRELLNVSNKVREDYYIQWATLGRRTLFELLAMESEQLNLQTSYATSLFELIASSAFLKIQSGELFSELNIHQYGK